MKKAFCVLSLMGILITVSSGYRTIQTDVTGSKEVVAKTENMEILLQVVDSAKDEFDIDEVALWLRDEKSGREEKILQTIRPDGACWYMPDGTEFVPVSMDSIYVGSQVYIYNEDPLQLIVEGCPDYRNIFSYFVDVPSKKAWYVPSNSGYMGNTWEEGYMVFRSYRYVSDPDIAGRYTFLQVFNSNGKMVDSLDLEHVILEEYNAEAGK